MQGRQFNNKPRISLASFLWDIGKQNIALNVTSHNAASHLEPFYLLKGISSKNGIRIDKFSLLKGTLG